MTAEEYESILCPTAADFAAWTKSLFTRAQAALDRVAKAYPNLGKKKRARQADELPELYADELFA